MTALQICAAIYASALSAGFVAANLITYVVASDLAMTRLRLFSSPCVESRLPNRRDGLFSVKMSDLEEIRLVYCGDVVTILFKRYIWSRPTLGDAPAPRVTARRVFGISKILNLLALRMPGTMFGIRADDPLVAQVIDLFGDGREKR